MPSPRSCRPSGGEPVDSRIRTTVRTVSGWSDSFVATTLVSRGWRVRRALIGWDRLGYPSLVLVPQAVWLLGGWLCCAGRLAVHLRGARDCRSRLVEGGRQAFWPQDPDCSSDPSRAWRGYADISPDRPTGLGRGGGGAVDWDKLMTAVAGHAAAYRTDVANRF